MLMCPECLARFPKTPEELAELTAKKEKLYCFHVWMEKKLEHAEKIKEMMKKKKNPTKQTPQNKETK